jgi:hypothetical protein
MGKVNYNVLECSLTGTNIGPDKVSVTASQFRVVPIALTEVSAYKNFS